MIDWLYYVAPVVVLFVSGLFVGLALDFKTNSSLKRENERLNKQLHVLTDRDSRGRFRGGK
jgi:hypothetical protein